jgi:hypothetical protein
MKNFYISLVLSILLNLTLFKQSHADTNKAEFSLDIEIPKLKVSEYHAPYLATWIETENRKTVIATSLWYDEQHKWLKDIRQWWRKTGRHQKKPYDGITGATRRPGMHKLKLSDTKISEALTPGNYILFIEAAREVGGREVLQIPFSWPIENKFESSAQGEKELGKITLSINTKQESS